MSEKPQKQKGFRKAETVELAFDWDSDAETVVGEEDHVALAKLAEKEREREELAAYPIHYRLAVKIGRAIRAVFKGIAIVFFYGLHMIWACILFVLFFPFIVLIWIPWTWFPSSRPMIYINKTKRRRVAYGTGTTDRKGEMRDAFAFYGNGLERLGPRHKRFSSFCKVRTWEIYEVFRDSWRTLHRQGLQIASVISGAVLILYQIEMMAHDFSSPSILAFYDGHFGGAATDDPHALLTAGDPLCAYVVGTGVANWGDNLENLVWYGFYHAYIILLCLMLIMDETFNVRMGLFAPQWSRMGIGYTIMFLVSATLSTSPNWGWSYMIRLRYAVLVVIFFLGIYNVLRTLVVGANLTHHTYANTTYRNRRHPIRPWEEREWQRFKDRQDFRQRAKGDEPRYWTEKRQLDIGDHCWNYQKVDRKMWNFGEKQIGTRKIYTKTEGETKLEYGRAGRQFWHGLPIKLPDFTKQDLKDMQPYSRFKNFKSFYGIHHWHPWRRWDKPKDDKERAQFDWERKSHTYERYCTYWFDLRRIYACACALAAFAVHVGLMCDVFARQHWTSYRDGYTNAVEEYATNKGGSKDDICQYYTGTHLAIFPQPGVGSLKGVANNMFWLGLWHVFMLGMCVGVFLVAFTNNRVFGMHLPWPVTLIGPRLSSNGLGWTLGFIAWATLQLGFFLSQAPIVRYITRCICYACLIGWVLFLAPNEPLSNLFARDPFWNRLSERAFIHMDSKIFHKEVYDFAKYDPYVKKDQWSENI